MEWNHQQQGDQWEACKTLEGDQVNMQVEAEQVNQNPMEDHWGQMGDWNEDRWSHHSEECLPEVPIPKWKLGSLVLHKKWGGWKQQGTHHMHHCKKKLGQKKSGRTCCTSGQ